MGKETSSDTIFKDVLELLSDFEAGKFSKRLPLPEDSSLKPLIDKLNNTAKILESQAQVVLDKENFLSTVLSSLTCLVAYMDRDLNYLYVNEAYERWFGVSRDKCLKSNMQEIIGEAGVEALKPYLAAAYSGQPQRFDLEVPFKFGGSKTIKVQYIPNRSEKGDVIGITVIADDITEKCVEEIKNKCILSELSASKMLLDSIINSHPSAIFAMDREHRYTLLNDAMVSISGAPKEQLIGKKLDDIWPKEIADKWSASNQQVIATGEVTVIENELIRKSDHSHRFVRITKFAIRNADDVIIGMAGIALDLTEERIVRDELVAKSSQMKRLINGIPALISHWDLNLRNLAANDKYTQRFGKNPDQMLGLHYKDVIGPIFETAKPYMEKAISGEVVDFTQEIIVPDGSKTYINVIYQPDFVDGQVKGFFTIAVDVTRQRVSEVERARLSTYLEIVLDSIQQGIWGLNLKGEVTFINQAAVKYLGYSDESELIGKPMHALVHYAFSDGRPHAKESCPMYDSFRNGRVHRVKDDVLWKKDGTSFPISYYSAPIVSDGECVGSVVSFEDLSEQRNLEKDLQSERMRSIRNAKLASLGEMSAGIAHEINNPLAIISGSVGLILKYTNSPEKVAEKVEVIQKSCTRIARIVSGLRKFSRSGDRSHFAVHRLDEIIKEVSILTESKSKRHNTPITIDCAIEAAILCDEVEIEQVLVNLICNSIDAVKKQLEKWVKVSVYEEGAEIVLRIMDSGSGIPNEIQNKLFQPFFTTKGVGQGTGLGLSIAKGILDEHKSTITIVNECPHTCFEIRIPKAGRGVKAA